MLDETILNDARRYHIKMLGNQYNGHDLDHVLRVERTAVDIAETIQHTEGININIDVVRLIALLHDVDDKKLSPNTYEDKKNAKRFLKIHKIPGHIYDKVIDGLDGISYSDKKKPCNIEAACVQDADRIDTFGVIGIIRAVQYGTKNNRPIYNPKRTYEIDIWHDNNYDDTVFDHIANKSAKLFDSFNTRIGRILAEKEFKTTQQFINEYIRQDKFGV